MRDEFGDEPAKSKTRAELQDDLRKYGITPRPGFDPSGPNLPEYRNYLDDPKEKAKARRLENEDLKDKRQPKSDLIRQAELEKMKEILNKPKGGGGGGAMPKSNRDLTKNYKAGGKVSSASKRADGCAIRGKTRA